MVKYKQNFFLLLLCKWVDVKRKKKTVRQSNEKKSKCDLYTNIHGMRKLQRKMYKRNQVNNTHNNYNK